MAVGKLSISVYDQTAQFLYSGARTLDAFRIATGELHDGLMMLCTTSDGKAAGTLNAVAAQEMLDVIRFMAKDDQFNFKEYSEPYRIWKRTVFSGVGRTEGFWVLTGAAMQSLRVMRQGKNNWLVGISADAKGAQNYYSKERRSIRVADYVYYGIWGTMGKGNRFQPPRNFYDRAIARMVARHAPEMLKTVKKMLVDTYTPHQRTLAELGKRRYEAQTQTTVAETPYGVTAGSEEWKIKNMEQAYGDTGESVEDSSSHSRTTGPGYSIKKAYVKYPASKEYKKILEFFIKKQEARNSQLSGPGG